MHTHYFLKHQRAGKFQRTLYNINIPSQEILPNQLLKRVLKGGKRLAIPFPCPSHLQIPFPTARIPFPLQNSEKNPRVTHTTFSLPSPKLRLPNMTQQRLPSDLLVFLLLLWSDGSSSLLFQERCLPLLQSLN